jgi:hypothetical protein
MKAFAFFVVAVVAFVAFLHWRESQESRTAERASGTRNEIVGANPAASNSDPPTPERIVISEKPMTNGPEARIRSTVPRTDIRERPSPPPAAPVAGSDEDAREFKVAIMQIVPSQGALASGGFYRLNSLPPPSYRSPLEERPGEPRRTEDPRGWTPVGDLFITGIPQGLADGEQFRGWLMRTGAKTITMDDGKYRTVPAYRVAPRPASADVTPKPGEWMLRNYRRSLER